MVIVEACHCSICHYIDVICTLYYHQDSKPCHIIEPEPVLPVNSQVNNILSTKLEYYCWCRYQVFLTYGETVTPMFR